MVEGSEIKFVVIHGHKLGRQSAGHQAAYIGPVTCHDIIQCLKADEFIFVKVGSLGTGLGEIAGRIPVTVKKLGVIENQPRFFP